MHSGSIRAPFVPLSSSCYCKRVVSTTSQSSKSSSVTYDGRASQQSKRAVSAHRVLWLPDVTCGGDLVAVAVVAVHFQAALQGEVLDLLLPLRHGGGGGDDERGPVCVRALVLPVTLADARKHLLLHFSRARSLGLLACSTCLCSFVRTLNRLLLRLLQLRLRLACMPRGKPLHAQSHPRRAAALLRGADAPRTSRRLPARRRPMVWMVLPMPISSARMPPRIVPASCASIQPTPSSCASAATLGRQRLQQLRGALGFDDLAAARELRRVGVQHLHLGRLLRAAAALTAMSTSTSASTKGALAGAAHAARRLHLRRDATHAVHSGRGVGRQERTWRARPARRRRRLA
eukprot:scaffold3218_cov350-Prasinococcus_capsulatus_cf.AAC.7